MNFMNAEPKAPTLVNALWPIGREVSSYRFWRLASLAIGGALALTLSAKLEVPLPLVPITLQSLVVLLLGASLGLGLSVASVSLYLTEGLFNLPVFAGTPEKGIGFAYMMGPTGGYLVGFLVCVAVVGFCVDRGYGRSIRSLLMLMCLGHALIFAFGYVWLAKFVGFDKAWVFGVAPFYAATILKTLLAVAILSSCWKGIERLRH